MSKKIVINIKKFDATFINLNDDKETKKAEPGFNAKLKEALKSLLADLNLQEKPKDL